MSRNHRRSHRTGDRELCLARTTTSGEPCRQTAGYGTDHLGYGRCKHHGGATKAGALAGGAEMARHLSVLYGQPVDVDPTDALLQEVRRSAGHVQWMSLAIQAMGEQTKDRPYIEVLTLLTDTTYRSAAFMLEYRREREHLARVAKLAIDAGIAERHVQLAEQQGQLVAGAIQTMLARLELTPDQRKRAPAIVRGTLIELGTQQEVA